LPNDVKGKTYYRMNEQHNCNSKQILTNTWSYPRISESLAGFQASGKQSRKALRTQDMRKGNPGKNDGYSLTIGRCTFQSPRAEQPANPARVAALR
jgi:hypothetical protein